MIASCSTCNVEWDIDYDPPKCDNPDHPHELREEPDVTTSIDLDTLGIDTVRRDQYGRYLIVPPQGGDPIGYTRVTTVAKTLDSGGGLAPWKAAMTASGIIMRRGLRAQWEALIAEHGDPWYASETAKEQCKRLVEECAAVGGANDRKEIGSALHSITALADTGKTLPHLTPETEAELKAYRTGLALSGIDIDYDNVELTVVLDEWRVAGTFDRLAHVPGFELPLVTDLKTGADLSYSWQSIAVQLAGYSRADNIYRQGAAKDGSQDQRLPFPEVDQRWGLVLWLPAGDADLQLFLVDLTQGWGAFDASMWARQWRNRRDLAVPISEFNYDIDNNQRVDNLTAQLEASLEAQGIEPPTDFGNFDTIAVTPEAKTVDPERAWLQERIDVIGQHDLARTMLHDHWPPDLPTLRASDAHTPDQLATIEQLLDGVERAYSLGFPPLRPA